MIRRFLWRCVASVAMLLALAGIPLPGLPTVPFILLSAWAAGKGWPKILVTTILLGTATWLWRRPE
ncbi:DUF454 family protein [Nitrincola alkalisediminis]|uniref:DUF454 family protein n=1 Tax=Nitrincola alkalisediminis TaxID=1366656 RepID=UPI00187573C0|nr:DUF454 family protein [Nitrincola alkalisediminis]